MGPDPLQQVELRRLVGKKPKTPQPGRRRPGEVQNTPTTSCANVKVLLSVNAHLEIASPLTYDNTLLISPRRSVGVRLWFEVCRLRAIAHRLPFGRAPANTQRRRKRQSRFLDFPILCYRAYSVVVQAGCRMRRVVLRKRQEEEHSCLV